MYGDPLNYHFRGWYLLHRSSTDARFAGNIPPFQYVALPGYLRIPFLLFSDRFDVQLRLIQIGNILTLVSVGVLFSYFLHLFLPTIWRKAAAPLAFTVILLSTQWQLNVFLPLGDIFFSFFLCTTMLVIRSINTFADVKHLPAKLTAIFLLGTCAAMTKFTGFLLVIYALLCWFPMMGRKIRQIILWAGAGSLLLMVAFVSYQWPMLSFYANAWLARVSITSPYDWLLNLLGISLPDQIIPNFHYLFTPQLTNNALSFLHFNWSASIRDVVVLGLGFCLSGLIVIGIWRCRQIFFPEIVLFTLCLPIVAPITTSTTRYLHPFQALIIIFFYCGCRRVFPHIFHSGRPRVKILIVVATTIILVLVTLRINGAARNNSSDISSIRTTINSVAMTYQQVDNFLATLNPETTRLLYTATPTSYYGGDAGKWQPIRELCYEAPDANLANLVRHYDVYAVFDQDLKYNHDFEEVEGKALSSLSQWGRFRVEKVLDVSNRYAWGRIYRIMPVDRVE